MVDNFSFVLFTNVIILFIHHEQESHNYLLSKRSYFSWVCNVVQANSHSSGKLSSCEVCYDFQHNIPVIRSP